MSEVIEDYIRRNPDLTEDTAFERFLQNERIKAWIGADDARRDRLGREFRRVWQSMHPPASGSAQHGALVREVKPATPKTATPTPAAPKPAAPATDPAPASAPAQRLATGMRRLQVMCPACAQLDVWLQDGVIACRQCARSYDDMLQLIPVHPVGPFAYVFGEGFPGYVKAAVIAAGLGVLYVGLRWIG